MVTRNKVRCAIRVDEEVYRVAQERSKRRDVPLAEVLSDAVRRYLLGHKTDEHLLLGMVQQLAELEHREHAKVSYELHVIKEMLGLFVQAFFKTVPVPANWQSEQAERQSLMRYDEFMGELARQIRQRQLALEQQLGSPMPLKPSEPGTPPAPPPNPRDGHEVSERPGISAPHSKRSSGLFDLEQ